MPNNTEPDRPTLMASAPIAYAPPDLQGERLPPLPAGAPDDLDLRWQAPIPIPASRADLDVPLRRRPSRAADPRHRLVTIGDSLTQGFKSFAIAEPWLSWPMIVAHEMGLRANYAPGADDPDSEFTFASFSGPAKAPGLPLNLEAVLRAVDAAVGGRSLDFQAPTMVGAIGSIATAVADYWQHGEGAVPPLRRDTYHHNLAVWGFDVRDALSATASRSTDAMQPQRMDEHFIERVAGYVRRQLHDEFLASYPMQRTAVRVLAGPDPDATQLDAAERLGADGGIETLVVALGANNALGVVKSLELRWTTSPECYDPKLKSAFDIWAPTHFAHEYAELVERIESIDAQHVILATVPHVTIVPLLRGVGEKPYYSRYFARYTRPWVTDAEFDASVHPCLTGDEARAIDGAIDQYNYTIKRAVHDARKGNRDWYLLDMCGLLDRLAYRRYLASPAAQPEWFDEYPMPPAVRGLSPRPDTRFFGTDLKGRNRGGLIALDGVHPTTIGYGVLAQEVIDIMTKKAGVRFLQADGAPRPDKSDVRVDFDRLIALDSMISDPPALLDESLTRIAAITDVIDLISLLMGKAPV